MADATPLHDPYDIPRVIRRIRKLWESGYRQISQRARERMLERGFDDHDLTQIVRYGSIVEVSPHREWWRYRIEGRTVENDRAGCVVQINRRLIVITVFWTGKWSS